MSITDLADACNVGESSVFRFCKTMKLKGYQEFKIALAHSISHDDETPQLSGSINIQDTIEEYLIQNFIYKYECPYRNI